MQIVVVDAGGTHVRFALAEIEPGMRPRLGAVARYRTREHSDLAAAWQRFAEELGTPLPAAAAIGVAAPLGEPVLRFVNCDWTIDTRTLARDLGLDQLTLLNDFGAIAHAVPTLKEDELAHVHGPERDLARDAVISVIGPGTGLGVAILIRRGETITVLETEGSHVAFAPLDREEENLAEALRAKFGRVSMERVVSGPGLVEIASAMGRSAPEAPGILWDAACSGEDPIAARALERFVQALGSAAGDLALAHGSSAVVLAGSLANRIIKQLRSPLFSERFEAKGRYRVRMERIPVKVATVDELGLLGAAVAFEREHLVT